MDGKIPKRSEVQKEYTWNLADIFENDEEWEKAYENCLEIPARLGAYKGKISKSAEALYSFLCDCDECGMRLSALYRYASLKGDEDTALGKYQEMTGRAYSLFVTLGSETAFSEPEILSIDDKTLERFYSDEPKLALYRRHIDRTRSMRAHVLSEAEEKILALAGEIGRAPEDIFSKFNDADMRFPSVSTPDGRRELTHGTFIPMMKNADRKVRRDAFKKLYKTYKSYENTSAAILDAQLKQQTFFARARNFKDNITAALEPNEVPVKVYESLIQAVNEGLPSMHRYVSLRKKLLGYDTLHMYDLYLPIVGEEDEEVTYETAKENCLAALCPLGKDYLRIIKEGFDNRWIDVYENKGKRSGAYSAGARPHPYVLMNYKNTLDCQFTLIHEMGHSLHSYLSKEKQPAVYSDYVIFVAEVASTCNEVLLMKYLLSKTHSRARRAYLINYFLEQFRTTLFRQTMFAEFELEINRRSEKGVTLTAETLNEIYYGLNKRYYGKDMVIDREIESEWARIPHFYYDFYVYQYATGFSAAVALANRILEEGESAAKDYLGFLSGGCSLDPVSLLRGAGVDMESPEVVRDAIKFFDELIDEFENLTSDR